MPTLYPYRYGDKLVTLETLQAWARGFPHPMHPAFDQRFWPWLEAQGGVIGIGGAYRALGSQPDKPGFAEEGKSFHQPQRFASGLTAYAAFDLVARNPGTIHRAPKWSEVPRQGSAEAKRWKVHCNIDSESWHMQPIELDGWVSWVDAGRPDPAIDTSPPSEDDMQILPKPKLLLDTRVNGNRQPVKTDSETVFMVPGERPDWANGAIVNITATDTTGPGWLLAWPGADAYGDRRGTVTFDAPGKTVTNLAMVPLNGHTFKIRASIQTHIVVELVGWCKVAA